MFKAKIIEDKNYYAIKSRQLLLIVLLTIPLGLFLNLTTFPIWQASIFAIGYLYVAFLLFKNAKSIRSTVNNRKIEISDDIIRIIDRNNKELELYEISEISEMVVMKEYKLPQEDVKDIIEEILGKPKINFIKFVYHNESKQVNFEIDSNYMLGQLNEVINNWSNTGLKLQRTN